MLLQVLKHELPLILFTVCAPAGVGALWCATVSAGMGQGGTTLLIAVSLVLTAVGMLASVIHLAKPLRAPRSISNWKTSWLSREILIVSGFALLTALCVFLAMAGWNEVKLALLVCASVVGLVLLFAISTAYRVHGQPGWDGPEGLLEVLSISIAVAFALAGLLEGAIGCIIGFSLTYKSSADRRERINRLDSSPRVLDVRKSMQQTHAPRRAYLWLWVAAAVMYAVAYLLGMNELSYLGIACIFVAAVLLRACFYALASTARYVPPAR